MTRDYYADLELPATADVNDVKKQFRKLGEYLQSCLLDFADRVAVRFRDANMTSNTQR